MSDLLDIGEVARLLRVSRRHVAGLVARGELSRPVRLGRSVRWRAAEVAAWIDDGCGRCGQGVRP